MNSTVTDLLGREWAASFQTRSIWIPGTKRLTEKRLGEMDWVFPVFLSSAHSMMTAGDTAGSAAAGSQYLGVPLRIYSIFEC